MGVADLHIANELVEQFILGNQLAFELIFHKTKGKLKGFLNKVLPAGEDAESLLQEIYLKLWSTRKFVQSGKNFEAYLFTIARNMVIDVMRKRLHRQKYLEGLFSQLQEVSGNNLDTMTMVNYSELEKKLFELIERLPEKQKEIFKLNRLEGLTYKEVAAKLNLSENTVDFQMRKTMAFFREEMKHFLQLIFIV